MPSESNVLQDVKQPAGTFNYANPRAIHWGAGSLAQLASELKRLQVTRVAIVTARSLGTEEKLLARAPGEPGAYELNRLPVARVAIVATRSLVTEEKLLARVRGELGDAELHATEVVGQHAPLSEIEAAVEHTTEVGIDGIVSFGGGSAIDSAKMVAVKLADRHGLR